MNHRYLRAVRLPAYSLLLIGVGLLRTPMPAFAEYVVVPGSGGNAIHLAIQCPPTWSIVAEVLSQPAWMTGLTLGCAPQESGQGVHLRFDVDPAARLGEGGTLVVSLAARDPQGALVDGSLRRLPLRLAPEAPPVQRSYRIDECCLPSAGIEGAMDGRPDRPVLLGASPNPWSTRTTVRFGLPSGGCVTLRILDVAGRLRRVVRAPDLAPGYHQIPWDGCGPDGQMVPPGLYFYELRSGRWVATGKTLLCR